MFHNDRHAGSDRFWEEAWNDGRELEEAIRFCAVDPLAPLFDRYTSRGSRLLEGGCGQGQYVVYYGLQGVRVVGVDFAGRALARLKRYAPTSTVCRGNVAQLPFCSGAFEAYYSGGVVEHFEEGAETALQ